MFSLHALTLPLVVAYFGTTRTHTLHFLYVAITLAASIAVSYNAAALWITTLLAGTIIIVSRFIFRGLFAIAWEWISITALIFCISYPTPLQTLLTVLHTTLHLRLFKKAITALISPFLLTSFKRSVALGLSRFFDIVLLTIACSALLQYYKISPTPLFTLGGIGGLISTLAAQDVISNILSGLILHSNRYISDGDKVTLPACNISGTIKKIGWHHSEILGFDQRCIYIPNTLLNTAGVVNLSRQVQRRLHITFGIRLKDKPKISAILNAINRYLSKHPAILPKPLIHHTGIGTYDCKIDVYAKTKPIGFKKHLSVQHDVLIAIGQIVLAHNADFPFPTFKEYYATQSS